MRKIIEALVSFKENNFFYVEDLSNAVELSVITKCPEKYLLVDRETGTVYIGTSMVNKYMPKYSLWKELK
jgi:hypothetical protein